MAEISPKVKERNEAESPADLWSPSDEDPEEEAVEKTVAKGKGRKKGEKEDAEDDDDDKASSSRW